jgi:hypothetical protein
MMFSLLFITGRIVDPSDINWNTHIQPAHVIYNGHDIISIRHTAH